MMVGQSCIATLGRQIDDAIQTLAQGQTREAKGAKAPLSQVKVTKKDKKF